MHNIGKILWLILDKTKSIEPVQVISKTTLENLEGKITNHNVVNSAGDLFCVEESEATVFNSPEEAQSYLLKMASDLVQKLVDAAKEKSGVFQSLSTPTVSDPAQKKMTSAPASSNPSGLPMVELPDGTMARVHLPEVLQ